jgi:hypothetical protein
MEKGDEAFLLTAKNVGEVDLRTQGSSDGLLTPVVQLSRAKLEANPAWPDKITAKLCLMIDDHKSQEIMLASQKKEEVLPKINDALKTNPEVVVWPSTGELKITAVEPAVSSIRLLYDCSDPFTNRLNSTERITHSGTIFTVDATKPNLQLRSDKETKDVKDLKETDSVAIKPYRADSLVLTSHRLGGLELRYTTGKSETNVLNEPVKADWATISWLMQPSLWGIFVSWLLLSLGAPFWYDSLKDLLKLRSSLAGKEEAQRKDRQTDSQPARAPKPADK